MITPSNATVKNYAGNLGEKDTTAEESGYTNHVLVDYIVGGANRHFNPEENKDANMYISSVSNKLILGLYDIETGEYIINKNCMVFNDKETYDNAVEQMSTYAAEYYKYAAFIQLSFNLNLRTYNILSTLQDEKCPSIENKARDILLYLAGEFYKKTEEYSSYLKPKDRCVFHSGSFFPSLYHALIDMINSNEILPDVLVEILKETANSDDNILEGAIAFVDSLSPSSIVVRLFAQTHVTNYYDYLVYRGEVIKRIVRKFREEDINFAFPSTSLYIEKGGVLNG